MRPTLFLAAVALTLSAPARADTAAEIAAIEQAWGNAFLTGDRAYLERLLAPEFKLMRAEGGRTLFTPREQWFGSLDRYSFHAFEVRTLDVVERDDTAVATIEGRWKITLAGRGSRDERFIVSDTFVRRDGRWQVIYRHSTPSPLADAPAAAPAAGSAGTERGD